MDRVLGALIALATAGCAQVFGIDETSAYPDAGAGIRLSFEKRYIGATIVSEPMDLTDASATYLVEDAADPSGFRRIPGTLENMTTLYGDVAPGVDATIQFTLPEDDIIRLFAIPGRRSVRGLYTYNGRPGAEPAPPNAAIDVAVTLDTAYVNEGLSVLAAGPWSARGYPELPGAGTTAWDPPPIMYAAFGSLTGRPLERIQPTDAVLVLRHAPPAQLQGYLEVPPFSQQDGLDAITGTLMTVPLDQTLGVTLATTAPGPRFAQTRPVVGTLALGWSLNAAPGWRVASTLGPQLHGGSLAETSTTLNVMYGNPFLGRDWQTTFLFSTNEYRTFTPTGLPAVNLYAGLYTVGSASQTMYDLPQGLPITISLAGTALTTDGMALTLDRSRSVELSAVVDRDACDLYGFTLYELVMQGAGTAYAPRVAMNATAPRMMLPGDLFAVGVPYTIRVTCHLGGLTGLAQGDFTMRDLPVSIGYLDSGVFTVSP